MLGDQVKHYRSRQGLTMKELAEKSGLSNGYISQLERNQVEPSLASLRKLATALDIPVFLLLGGQEGSPMLVRNDHRLIMANKEDTVRYEVLSVMPSPKFIPQALLMHYFVAPHIQTSEDYLTHDAEEIILVHSGQLTVTVVDEITVLAAGDTILIPRNLPHLCRNDGDTPTEGLSSLSPPVWGRGML